MSRNRYVVPALMSLLLLSCGALGEPVSHGGTLDMDGSDTGDVEVIAEADGIRITRGMYDAYKRHLGGYHGRMPRDVPASAILEGLIDVLLLSKHARAMGLDAEPRVHDTLIVAQAVVLADAYANDFARTQSIGPDELRQLYVANRESLWPAYYLLREIAVDDRQTAEDVIANLRQGESFAALAQKYSNSPTAPSGGLIGWTTLDRFPAALRASIVAVPSGSYTEEALVVGGRHAIYLVDGIRPSQAPELDSVKDDFRGYAVRQGLAAQVRALREKSDVRVFVGRGN